MSVLVIGEVHVAPDCMDEFKAYLREILPDSRAYDGFERIELYEDTEDEGSVIFVEYFESRSDQEKYIAWRTETGVMAKLGAMFVGDVRVRYFRNMGL
jgi:quinol monooxygenase YgiN